MVQRIGFYKISSNLLKCFLTVLIGTCVLTTNSAHAQSTLIRSVASLPATCNGGNAFKSSDMVTLITAGAGAPYICSAPNVWTAYSLAGSIAADFNLLTYPNAANISTFGSTKIMEFTDSGGHVAFAMIPPGYSGYSGLGIALDAFDSTFTIGGALNIYTGSVSCLGLTFDLGHMEWANVSGPATFCTGMIGTQKTTAFDVGFNNTTPAVDDSSLKVANTAYVLGQLGSSNPLINGTAAAGTSTRMSRQDHVHPTDSTRAPLASPSFTTQITSPLFKSTTNCASSASPAVCAAAPAGMFTVAAGATTKVVNTTAVTANSEILINNDSSLGTALSVTCNTALLAAPWQITARTAGTSFTLTLSAAPSVNPQCFSYSIIN